MEVKVALASEEAASAFVASWLACTLPAAAWTHPAHILVAAWLISGKSAAEALAIMRSHIPRYNVATGGANTPDSGYHETLTCFWIAKIAAFLRGRPAAEPTLARLQAAVHHFSARRDWLADHYSFNVVKSRQARAEWVAPDRQPIDESPT